MARFSGMLQDLRFALRAIRRAPLFFGGAALILALGIGLSTATFEIFYTVLLEPLPVLDQNRLVALSGDLPGSALPVFPLNRRLLRGFQHDTRTLSAVAGVAYDGPWDWSVRDPSDAHSVTRLHSSVVTANFFGVLGARAEIGRTLLPQDDTPRASKVVVISHDLWQRQYGADPRVLGRRVIDQASGTAYEIVGVMPPGFAIERGADTWRALDAQFPVLADSDLDSPFALVRLVGRLAPGADPGAARAELASFLQRAWSARNPAIAGRLTATMHLLPTEVFGDVRPALRLVAAAVALLLLIACVNVANLLLIRGAARRSELAMRATLGATRGRLVRQLVAEGIVLALAGGAAGLIVAAIALSGVVAFASAYLPRAAQARLDGVTVAAAAAIAAVSVLLSVVGPALTVSAGELFALVRSGAQSVIGSRRSGRARQGLVSVQIALAFVVLTMAGLLGRSLERFQALDLGFSIEHLAVIELNPADNARATAASVNAMVDALRARVASLPGVTVVAGAIQTPLSSVGIDGFLTAEGEPEAKLGSHPVVTLEFVSPDFFRALGVRIVRGRPFDDTDGAGSAPVVVVSQSVADHYWPRQNPIGRRLRCADTDAMCSVVGVSEDTRYRDLIAAHPTAYRPSHQANHTVFAPRVLLVRTTGDPAAAIPSIRAAIVAAEPSIAIGRAEPVRDLLSGPLARPRLNAALMSMFALAALALASIGVFGVLTFHISQRTRELGIRQALGATPAQLRGIVLREGLALQGIGLGCGIAIAVVVTRSARALLFAVGPSDPVAMTVAAALLIVFGTVAVAFPALRASRIDPSVALRAE